MPDREPTVVRYRVINGLMRYVYAAAREAGESGDEANRQAIEAGEWIKAVLR